MNVKHLEKFIGQYRNLNREIYVLFWGRIVTSMGSLIWPLMTLILKNKLGYDATAIALITMVMVVIQFPILLLGGKLADSRNRKHIIVVCDLVTVGCYIIAGLIPLSGFSVVLFYTAGVFANIEGPSYDALVADLSDSDSREKAYSLQYLGMNLGLVLAPTLGGFLFENYLWLAFLITAAATFSSTLLIILFVKRLRVEKAHVSQYEQNRQGDSLISILQERKALVLYALLGGFGSFVYAQFNYLLPLNMEALYGAKGAEVFGLLTSVNALVVIVATPLVTTFLGGIRDVKKILIGETLIVLGLYSYRYAQLQLTLCFLLMVLFTLGEVFNTLGHQPYMTHRIPATHWGRVNSFVSIVSGAFSSIGNLFLGRLLDSRGYSAAWLAVGIAGLFLICLACLLSGTDKKAFPLLYAAGPAQSDT